jgi:hypothetical protein
VTLDSDWGLAIFILLLPFFDVIFEETAKIFTITSLMLVFMIVFIFLPVVLLDRLLPQIHSHSESDE